MDYDVIIVGGSFAGQAAALQLGRARRRVLLLDSGKPRNRFARASHGFLGQDGESPLAIIAAAARQLSRYQSVVPCNVEATDAVALEGGFRIQLADGSESTGRRLILAYGVTDQLPALPGLQERWGVSVLHCPYCHGYELDERPMGVLASSEMAVHQAALVADWGPTTLFTQGTFIPSAEQKALLSERGVTIEEAVIAELMGNSPELSGVRLEDGRVVEIAGLFLAPRTRPSSDLGERIGCRFDEGPTGSFVSIDQRHQTSVPGVFAAGDLSNPMANATLAAAAGVMAASGTHHSLIHGIGRD